MFRITLATDNNSWINEYYPLLVTMLEKNGHCVQLVHCAKDIPSGDFAFFLGFGSIADTEILSRNRHNLVVHESELPKGKGWSPLTWQVLEGKNEIPITLFEAAEEIDSGKIYIQEKLCFNGTELIEELRKVQAEISFKMCLQFVNSYPEILISAREQSGESTYYRKRIPEDSELDIDKSLREQMNLFRVVDNGRYPAFFEFGGSRYTLRIDRMQE